MTPPPRRHIVATEELTWPASRAVAGSKLARLAVLARAGIAVPGGFVITTAAMRDHLDDALSAGHAAALLASLGRCADHERNLSVAHELRVAVQEHPIAPHLQDAVTRAYQELCVRADQTDAPVAVRSSAVVEDGEDRSFAGIFDTVLGVRGSEELLDAVTHCWAGAFSERALAYATTGAAPLGFADLGMAVGVVNLIPARVSGVAFSVHPVTGTADRVVVEAAPGVGAVVTPGVRDPERFELDKRDGRVLRASAAPGRRPVLTEMELNAVASAVRTAEEAFGHPVDVEWLVDGSHRLWVVQVRPVTGWGRGRSAYAGWDPTAFLPGV